MDADRFDTLARALSRRAVLRGGLGAGLLAASGGRVGAQQATPVRGAGAAPPPPRRCPAPEGSIRSAHA
jgi:hypothetical protein